MDSSDGMNMDELIGSQSYCVYHGQQYVERSFGQDRRSGAWYVTIPRPQDCTEASFPDALEFGNADDQWIKLPVQALSRRWREVVFGIWRGVKVQVTILHKGGQDIVSCGSNDLRAGECGLPGDQYQGWQGPVSADEVQLTYKEIHEYPINPPGGVLHREDVTVTRVPFGSISGTKETIEQDG